MGIGSIFHCSGKSLSLLPFHFFPPSIATKQKNVLAVISISLENTTFLAQLPNPTLQKPPERLQALGNARIIIKNPIFLLKRKGWKLLLLDSPSGMELLHGTA